MRRRVVVGTSLLIVSVLTGCSSSGQPKKVTSSAGTPTPAGAQAASTTFTSTISTMPGLRFTWPTPGWRPIDTAAEVIVHPPGLPGASLHVAKGMFPVDPTGGFLTTRTSATAVIAALRGLPALSASPPVREHIGEGLAVVRTDLRLSPSAPRSGFEFLVYRGSNINAAAFTIKPGMSVRVYAGVFRAPYGRELLDVAVEASNRKVFARWTTLADRALQSLHLPKGLVPGRTIYN